MHLEKNISEDIENKEDHCSKASSDVSSRSEPYLNPEDDKYKMVVMFFTFCSHIFKDHVIDTAHIAVHHATAVVEELEEVDFVRPPSRRWRRRQQTKSRRRTYIVIKIKKRKLSTGSILLKRRKNREKWRYNEDLELGTKIEELEEESDLELGTKIEELEEESEDYCSSDSSDSSDSEFYLPFDESGKRWYYVSLVYGKRPDDHEALLLAMLGCDSLKSH
ncbi:hypothetical protein CRYUN_Cryun31cG0102400 [Craigia yunnanensis]